MGAGRGCGRFPTALAAADLAANKPTLQQLPERLQHSPSPDTLSDISALEVLPIAVPHKPQNADSNSLLLLPHPRPKHNIRQQLLAANWLPNLGTSGAGVISPPRPNFPSPTNNSVQQRVSAFEKGGGSPATALSLITNGTHMTTSGPMSPKSTVFRTKPVIHFSFNGEQGSSNGTSTGGGRQVGSLGTRLKFPSSNRQPFGNNKVGVLE